MQADEVELGQIFAPRELFEGVVEQPGPRPRHPRQFTRKGGLRRVEIGGAPGRGRGRGVDVHAQALAKTQLACRPLLRRRQARVQQGQLRAQRVQFLVVAVGVADVGHVA